MITSADGERVVLGVAGSPTEPGHDLRDPHLTVTPDNRLMLIGGNFDPAEEAGPSRVSIDGVVLFGRRKLGRSHRGDRAYDLAVAGDLA